LGTFHVEDYRLTLSRSRDYVARVDDQDLISPDDLALFVDHADAICVTVEGNSNISAIAFNSCNEIAEILRDSWIGMVVGKRSVALAEKTANRHSQLFEQLRRNQGAVEVPEGIMHDWIAATVVSGATPEKTISVLQNYAAYKNIYRGAVSESKLLRRDGDLFHVSLRLLKKKVLKVELNADFDVQYRSLGNNRWSVTSRSTRIAELEGDQELPAGAGHGFLWHQNVYWLIEPRPEGVYLECRSLSLSRDIPFGLSLVVKPFLTSVPRESLQETLEDTIRALR